MSPLFASPRNKPRRQDNDDNAGQEETDDLPLSPDEDMPVIPDEERVFDMPS